MTNKIQKYNAEKQKNSAKISELQSRNRELDRLITEAENTEIVALMRSENISLEDFATIIKAFRDKSGAPLIMPTQEVLDNEE
jgi:hypothetical protein